MGNQSAATVRRLLNRPVIGASIHLWKMNQTFGDDKGSFASACMQLQKKWDSNFTDPMQHITHMLVGTLPTYMQQANLFSWWPNITSFSKHRSLHGIAPVPLTLVLSIDHISQGLRGLDIHAQVLDPARGECDCGYQGCRIRIQWHSPSESWAASEEYCHWHWT